MIHILDIFINFSIEKIVILVLGLLMSWIFKKYKDSDKIADGLTDVIQGVKKWEDVADEKGNGIIPDRYENVLDKFSNKLKQEVKKSLSKKSNKVLHKKLIKKGYSNNPKIEVRRKKRMKSFLFIVVLSLCFIVPCMADQVLVIDEINAITVSNEFSIEFNSGYMIDMSRADGRETLTAVHTISLIEYDLYEDSGINLDAGYRDKNGFVAGISFDLQLAKYFKKIKIPIVRNIDPQFGYLGGWNMNQAEEDKAIFYGPYFTLLKGKF